MPDQNRTDERTALQRIIDELHNLDDEARLRILKTVETFFGLNVPFATMPKLNDPSRPPPTNAPDREFKFSDRPTLAPKAFLTEKESRTDVERVTCLAYYLTYYRDSPHFTTLDISKLNTEAAQHKLSNAAYTVSNAVRAGLLAPAPKGTKQISAVGERLVDALPNRDAVRSLLADLRRRRIRQGAKKKHADNGKSDRQGGSQ